MSERPRFFDDLAGVAGGAFSALAGLREEAEAMIRAQARRDDPRSSTWCAARNWTPCRRWPPTRAPGRRRPRRGSRALEARLAALEARVRRAGSPPPRRAELAGRALQAAA